MSSLTPSSIYCFTKDCPPSSDWLTHMPSSAAGWAVGGVLFGLIIIKLICVFGTLGRVNFIKGSVEILAISVFLRAAMNLEAGNKMAMYKASIFFNYLTAINIGVEILIPVLVRIREKASANTIYMLPRRFSPIHTSLFILMIPAVVIMFNTTNSSGVDPSIYIIRTVVFCVMILAFISAIHALALAYICSSGFKYSPLIIVLQNLLLVLWASFMASRTFLPLDNPVRDSETMFYMLNIAPLFIIGHIPLAITSFGLGLGKPITGGKNTNVESLC